MEFLLGQGNERRGVIGLRAGVQRFEQSRLGDERLARSGRRAHHHPLLRPEPRQQRLFLHRVRRIGKLFEVAIQDFGTGESHCLLRQGDKETRRQGDKERVTVLLVSLSPCLLVLLISQ